MEGFCFCCCFSSPWKVSLAVFVEQFAPLDVLFSSLSTGVCVHPPFRALLWGCSCERVAVWLCQISCVLCLLPARVSSVTLVFWLHPQVWHSSQAGMESSECDVLRFSAPSLLVEGSEVFLSWPEYAKDRGLSQLDTDLGLLFILLPPSLSPPPNNQLFPGLCLRQAV